MTQKEVVLMKGTEAIAHAARRCGCDGYFGYPITPQSEILETLALEKPWETTGMVVDRSLSGNWFVGGITYTYTYNSNYDYDKSDYVGKWEQKVKLLRREVTMTDVATYKESNKV